MHCRSCGAANIPESQWRQISRSVDAQRVHIREALWLKVGHFHHLTNASAAVPAHEAMSSSMANPRAHDTRRNGVR